MCGLQVHVNLGGTPLDAVQAADSSALPTLSFEMGELPAADVAGKAQSWRLGLEARIGCEESLGPKLQNQ